MNGNPKNTDEDSQVSRAQSTDYLPYIRNRVVMQQRRKREKTKRSQANVYKWWSHLQESCSVSLTPTQRGYRWRLFLGMSIRQRLSKATAPESASAMCLLDTGPQPTPIIQCSRGGGEQRTAAPSQLKHLISQCYLKDSFFPDGRKRAAVLLYLCLKLPSGSAAFIPYS